MIRPRHREQGAALINVLVLVGILAALAAGLFDRLRLARHLDGARAAADAAQAAALAGEAMLLAWAQAEVQRWRRTASTVETDWVGEMKGKGIDGAKLAADARALVAKYAK